MQKNLKQPWITAGYNLFASEGPKGLKIEILAKLVNKSKSSFYHHFFDIENFMDELLAFHMERGKKVAEEIKLCKTIEIDFFNIILTNKMDAFFNKQLRVHRSDEKFKKCLAPEYDFVKNAVTHLWTDSLGLSENPYLAKIILDLTIDNFYLRIAEDSYSTKWCLDYFQEIKNMIHEIKKM